MVLAVATLLVCGFMVAIYGILRAEERYLATRQNEHRGAGQTSPNSDAGQGNGAPQVATSLAKAGSHTPVD